MKITSRSSGAVRAFAACVALAAAPMLAAAPVASAGHPIDQHILRLLGEAHSYMAAIDIKESGPDVSPAASSSHLDEIVVHRDSLTETYTRMHVEGQTVELAMKGNTICQAVAGRWHCANMGPQFGALLKETPEQTLKALGLHVVFTPRGTRRIDGQQAVGYGFTATVSGTRETGIFWLDPPGQRLIELDTLIVDGVAGRASTLSSKAVFRHWNDPGLKIPAIPGL